MRKLAFFTVMGICFALPTMVGCDGARESSVVEAPPAPSGETEPAIEGMTDEEYNAAMEADMNQ